VTRWTDHLPAILLPHRLNKNETRGEMWETEIQAPLVAEGAAAASVQTVDAIKRAEEKNEAPRGRRDP
jgi:hypothetical protein